MQGSLFFFLTVSMFYFTQHSFSQAGGTALPFLIIGASPSTNAMGELSSIQSNDPLQALANPGHIGIQSLTNRFSINYYVNNTAWLPQFQLSDLYYRADGGMLGARLSDFSITPIDISVGFGYSKVYLNLSEFIRTTEKGPEEIGRFKGYESSENYTYSIGIQYGIKIGLGYTSKNIISHLSPFGTMQDSSQKLLNDKFSAYDLGVVFTIPFFEIVDKFSEKPTEIIPKVSPLFDITTAYSLNNIGDKVFYIDEAQADPYPRLAKLGYSVKAGLVFKSEKYSWDIISAAFGREAQSLLFTRFNDGKWKYRAAPGDLRIVDNLIKGKVTGYIDLHRGWSWTVLDFVTFKHGSLEGTGRAFSTEGYSVHFMKVFQLMDIFFSSPTHAETPITYLAKHVDIQYHYSEYSSNEGSPLHGTKFSSISISFK